MLSRTRLASLPLLIGVGVGIAACSTGAANPPTTATATATARPTADLRIASSLLCVVTPDNAAKAFSKPVGDIISVVAKSNGCTYQVAAGTTTSANDTLAMLPQDPAAVAALEQKGPITRVSGLGPDAFFTGDSDTTVHLYVQHGQAFEEFLLTSPDLGRTSLERAAVRAASPWANSPADTPAPYE